ncbi:hypothetical protein GCM10010446_31740 [Streptomyces enissocaesilis]|uniref:Uncharacterized protein n=1 Tax=Streptomyces enissocaesilis TaxID=332589 RepID=A0ABN3X9G2_9ACTN
MRLVRGMPGGAPPGTVKPYGVVAPGGRKPFQAALETVIVVPLPSSLPFHAVPTRRSSGREAWSVRTGDRGGRCGDPRLHL